MPDSDARAPLPTRLILLSDLDVIPAEELPVKVRVLGCIAELPSHSYPYAILSYKSFGLSVDNSLLNTAYRVGEWVSVIGYLETEDSAFAPNGIVLRALTMFLAQHALSGPLDLGAYEDMVRARQQAGF
ncbi:hypothetical protein SAICODRAFT_7133 [Saitoella complicata NRRL Y-17804]|uniref:Uncharacterized protein n=1 Tax=Saitoella complicata (strain BCRC 22490 / CBS 7301 / JCM 7358 / NBRC 10748 / NRRL Y-17804) TaxID=698492 RepID=A0A0E9NR92_SAICN|nr:uncharacterized protein SAICODRAFT_7133 [Saitoella complicata NRRL Y-17804]ODQ53416.1 hypothetical protein SAICODRAFT_7133 [Saitoella complicata NRRL Y-17804]GAO52369.1 hypothetical protein G7K_6447-t1 [Saitoella complicata NRRL Y-17804]